MGNVYRDDVVDIDEMYDESDPISLDLYIDPRADPEYKQGQARAQYPVTENGVAIYEKVKSDCRISVQRLIWADGWRDGKHQARPQEMTLVVLKFTFVSTTRSDNATKLAWAEAGLSFWDQDESRAQDPEVVAWAPREPEQWNLSSAHARKATRTGASVGLGYQGASASVDRGKEREIEWDQECFDEGRTTHMFNPKTGRPNGVNWFLRQNPLQNHGLMPEFWAALLVSRQSSNPYLVRFTLQSGSGVYDASKFSVTEFLGLQKDGSTFSVTPKPGNVTVCNLEGENIIKSVNLQQLGSLVDLNKSTRLNVRWGPQPKNTRLGSIKPGEEGETRGEGEAGEAGETRETPRALDGEVQAITPHRVTGAARSNIASLPTHAPPVPGVDYSRLVSLEGRVAQAEARLAAQDLVILQLQQAMMAIRAHDRP
ncbi:putative peptidase S8 subtilisin kexin sedolisin [Rosellinia necatrix]|uniref:Putative peptidase S8 subtilisin kexin sedolisin n=1 Tax=Rosellinia necatrix TaxID=77044 RepID=A0A1W2TBG0_ROSNE|nr:putative peptidase S8 subtilisin kexin sedolisin [Rosellinia necatrix]